MDINVDMKVCMCAHLYVYVHMYVCMYTYVRLCVFICVCVKRAADFRFGLVVISMRVGNKAACTAQFHAQWGL